MHCTNSRKQFVFINAMPVRGSSGHPDHRMTVEISLLELAVLDPGFAMRVDVIPQSQNAAPWRRAPARWKWSAASRPDLGAVDEKPFVRHKVRLFGFARDHVRRSVKILIRNKRRKKT